METLKQLFAKYHKNGWPDRDTVHSYVDVYEKILEPYRHIAKNILEIGLMSGESLRVWTEYFDGAVYGMDCDLQPISGQADLTQAIADGLNIKIGDASHPLVIQNFFWDVKFDVVIEDANHDLGQQLQIYKTLKPYLSENAIYIIEDVQDIDGTRQIFENLDKEKNVEIIDRRHINNRYDDVLVIITDKK